ncbi:MAG: polymer-forming cytoskeletal protein, partial [Nitrosospira sp.]|nr:polymer-forming cytoskeletal protein [Nitrosospira sp.]
RHHSIVEGEIQVSHAIINGTVVGPIQANEYVELQAKAKVSGDIHYRTMEIQFGASIVGMLYHQDAEPDNKVKVVTLIPAAHGD